MSLNCTIIGAGNLATHLATALLGKGYNISQVYSQTEKSAARLAQKVNAGFVTDPSEIKSSAGIYFVAIKDDAIPIVLSKLVFKNKLMVHCSGSTPISVLQGYSENYGVMYPLQTFSKGRELDFSKIPVFIEANSKANLETIQKIASSLSGNVKELDSQKRHALHVAAVFACNFTNHMYHLADEVLKENGLPSEVLRPLIEETAQKVQELHPAKAQTGPAVRYDEKIISGHLKLLGQDTGLKELYKSISKSIFDHYQK